MLIINIATGAYSPSHFEPRVFDEVVGLFGCEYSVVVGTSHKPSPDLPRFDDQG